MQKHYRAIVFFLLAGCGRQTANSVPPAEPKHSHGKPTGEHGGHENHVGIKAADKSASPASLKIDGGDENLVPDSQQTLTFHLEQSGKWLRDYELLHERVMHLIVVRDDLFEFQHVHPKVSDSGSATVDIIFPSAGKYLLFADVQPKGEMQQTVRHELIVEGAPPAAVKLKVDIPGTLHVGDYLVNVKLEPSDTEAKVSFEIRDANDKPVVDLEPYLGAMGHLVVIKSENREFIHAHAETQSASKGVVEFAVHFTGPGIYKAWGQFQRQGEVFTVPAVLKVD